MWLNEKHIEKKLGRSTFNKATLKYSSELRKQKQELLKDCFKQTCRIFIKENLALHLIMDSRTVSAIDFRSRLGFKQQDPIMTQEQSVLTKIREAFTTKK